MFQIVSRMLQVPESELQPLYVYFLFNQKWFLTRNVFKSTWSFFRGAFVFSCRNHYPKVRLVSEKCGGVGHLEQSLGSSSSEGHERGCSTELQWSARQWLHWDSVKTQDSLVLSPPYWLNVWPWQITQYCFSLYPLGTYVKLPHLWAVWDAVNSCNVEMISGDTRTK